MKLKYKKFRKIKYFLIAVIVLFLFINRSFRCLVTNYFELRSLKKQKFQLEQETSRLQEELKQIKNPEYIESQARKEFGMIKPNERVYIFPPPDDN